MTHLLLHKTPNSVSSEPGAAQDIPTDFLIDRSIEVLDLFLRATMLAREVALNGHFGTHQRTGMREVH
jgi:hypothetical protein